MWTYPPHLSECGLCVTVPTGRILADRNLGKQLHTEFLSPPANFGPIYKRP